MTRIHDHGQDDPLEFDPDPETTDRIAAELCRQRYERERARREKEGDRREEVGP